MAEIGARRILETDQFVAWGTSMDQPGLSLTRPHDGQPATVGNGVMVALAMSNTEQVDAVHAKALALGGTDEGAPGARSDAFYAGYFRDPDGNKLNAFCMTGEFG
jgi:catechol 2,3-dioxygenase-like lactoylglutathione lyase family enzyme